MSFTPLMMKLVAALLDELPPNPTVIELGNQTFDPTISGSLTAAEDRMFPLVLDYLDRRGKSFDRKRLVELTKMSVEEQKPHTATYYRALGFSDYTAIDVNSKYGSLIMDLNSDLRSTYDFENTYDLVTNNGTGEHIFNQCAVFKNMHDLVKVGGVLLFVLPFYNWMNHGFFNFNPVLFADLAEANRYEIVRFSVACPVGQEVTATCAKVPDAEMRLSWQPDAPRLSVQDFQRRGAIRPRTPRNMAADIVALLSGKGTNTQQSLLPGVVEKIAERVFDINVVAALRKTAATAFAIPLQGMYSGANVENDEIRQRYVA